MRLGPVIDSVACPGRTIDLAMTFRVLKDPGGRTVLVDAGFYRPGESRD
jgi:hypothetical protein